MLFLCLQVVNQHLLHDLTSLGLWNPDMKNELVANNGSVQVGIVLWCMVVALRTHMLVARDL